MGAGEAGDEVEQRVVDRVGEGGGQAEGQRAPERVAQLGGVLGGGHPLLAGHRHPDGPALGHQLVDPRRPRRPRRPSGRRGRSTVSGPEVAQHVVELVGVAGPPAVDEPLQLELEVGQHVGVDQLAQLLGAEQLAQQVAVEREGGGPALGQRRVALVHVDGDPAEQQRLRERRRPRGVDRHDAHLPAAQVALHHPVRSSMSSSSAAAPPVCRLPWPWGGRGGRWWSSTGASRGNGPAAHMHGYLTRDGISPAEFLSIGREEARGYGARIIEGNASGASRAADGSFLVALEDGNSVSGPSAAGDDRTRRRPARHRRTAGAMGARRRPLPVLPRLGSAR